MSQPVRVVLASDDKFAVPLAVAGRSLISNRNPRIRLELYILDLGLSAANRTSIRASLDEPEVSLQFLDAAGALDGLPTPKAFSASVGTATYARLLIPDIIPDSVDRIVYLDSDVVVRRCISELYAADMTGKVALAVQDMVAGYVSAAPWGLANWFEAGRGPADLNFNGGVIVMDLEAWRREGIGRQAIAYVQSERFWRMVDQEGINAVAGSRIGDVDPRWNQQAVIFEDQFALFLPYPKRVIEQVRNDPWIVHFTGEAKPWAYPSDHPWAGEWYHYLELTAFRGWRPPQVARRTPASVQRWPRPPRGAAPPWSLHLENGAVASMSSNTSGRVRVTIETLGVRPWDVQVNYSLPGIDAGRTYVLKCDLKADRPRGAIIGVARRGGDWGGLGVFETVQLTSRWQTVIRRFGASDSASFGRVHFDLGAHESAVEIRRVSLHELPDGP